VNKEEELSDEIARLKQEIERLKAENEGLGHGMEKKKAVVAGDMTDRGIFETEIKKIDMANGFDREEVKVTNYFSVKGHQLRMGQVLRCSFCSIILTAQEKIESNNKVYCEKCYRQEEHDMSKDEYKIMLCASHGFTSTSLLLESLGCAVTIQRLTGLTKNEAAKKLERLLDEGYLFQHGILFKKIRVSSKGEEAMVAYGQVYRDEDCDVVRSRLSSIRVSP
jgi:hypothetical protein